MFFTFVFPVLFALFFGAMFARDAASSAIAVALVDEDRTKGSAAFVETLTSAAELDLLTRIEDQPLTRDAAIDLVRRGKRTACIIIPPGGFSDEASIFNPARPPLRLAIDPSRAAEAAMLQGALTRYAMRHLTADLADPARARQQVALARLIGSAAAKGSAERESTFSDMFDSIDKVLALADTPPSAEQPRSNEGPAPGPFAFEPIRFEMEPVTRRVAGPASSYEVTFPQAILWGIAGCAASFAVTLVVERKRGTLLRLRAAPLGWREILAAKALACFATTLIVALTLLAIARFAFGIIPASYPMLLLALVSLGIFTIGLMAFLAALGRSESSAGSLAWAVILILMMIGGGTIPIYFMPAWIRPLSQVSPFRWGILAIEGGIWRGFTLAEMAVPCTLLIMLGVVGFVLGARVAGALEAH